MSDRSAYFVSYADGYEEELTMDKLSSITPELIGSVKDSGPVDEGNIVGKLIDGYEWYAAGIIDNREAPVSYTHLTASAVAAVDVLSSFADVSMKNNYTRPEIAIDGVIDIHDGRHPVVELMLSDEIFVPNDIYLDTKGSRMSVITGPNMSGKSTYMRQTALITLMAQMGCFVPASYAKISVVDRIFTRVGASDDPVSYTHLCGHI